MLHYMLRRSAAVRKSDGTQHGRNHLQHLTTTLFVCHIYNADPRTNGPAPRSE